MRFVIILTLLYFSLYAKPAYDFWGNGSAHEKNTVKIRNTNLPKPDYIYENDTQQPNMASDLNEENINLAEDQKDISIKDRYFQYNQRGVQDPQITQDHIRPNLANDLDQSKTSLAADRQEMSIKDKYLQYNQRGAKEPSIADDLNPQKINLAPDYASDERLKRKREQLIKKQTNTKNRNSSVQFKSNKDINYKDESLGYTDNYIIYYEENKREKSFIDIIPYITIGNSLFEITSGDYSARVLDDSISASMTVDLGLNYIWENANIGYLWNVNFGQYDFNEKDRTNPDSQGKGEISGYIISVMPTIFYELNRAQTMSVLIGYGGGVSYINLDGSVTLARDEQSTSNSTKNTLSSSPRVSGSGGGTITNDILIENFYLSHGVLIEILHNNLMVSFTKVKIRIEENNQNIKINENRLNIGYKFSF